MKLNKKILQLGSLLSISSLPLVAISCGKEIKTVEKIEQENKLAQLPTELDKRWKTMTLAALYGVSSSNVLDLDDALIKKFDDQTSEFRKDNNLAFEIYAREKLSKDSKYFASKQIEWKKNGYFSPEDEIKLKFLGLNEIPTNEMFAIYWKNQETGIRDEIEKLLFVKKYFSISTKEEIEKVESDFQYTSSYLKYELKNYFLTKYAMSKKMVQIWKRSTKEAANSDDFFIKGYQKIDGVDSFNQFLESTPEYNKMVNSFETITSNSFDKQLRGYAGFELNPSYTLEWSYENLIHKNANEFSGFYEPNGGTLVNESNLNSGYNPYKNNSSISNEAVVVYLNQIAPILDKEIELPENVENKNKKKITKLLSFEKTIYKDKLDVLSYVFYLKDSDSLIKTAKSAFAKLGYKIKLSKIDKTLTDAVKNSEFVVIED
ncbi:HinT-interacting membrane complex lipoprotein P60 [Mycoplasmopsis lipofaciens]|uniref:HinT-interacting membrane complex lipoprotein P60 n=1 Tax=Mycoplasmopsis lipofaciens TaxID=114884 RepID=UPI00048A26F5|nr:variable surface lipoprotein [Mycoplasmopsis lipofaciens]